MPPLDEGEVLAQGSAIAVIKRVCESFGQDNACNGRDTSLDGYSIDFEFFRGREPEKNPEPGLTVTLDQGSGSKGKDVSGELTGSTYTVCEVPVATSPTETWWT